MKQPLKPACLSDGRHQQVHYTHRARCAAPVAEYNRGVDTVNAPWTPT